MVRLVLTLTVVAALAATAITEFVVRPRVRSVIASRDKSLQDFREEQLAHSGTKSKLDAAQAKLDQTERKLSKTMGELAAMTEKAAEQQQRATALESDLSKVTQDLSAAKANLAAWHGLPPVDQIRGVVADAKRLRRENEVLEKEKQILLTAVLHAQRITREWSPDDPVLPVGLKGKVTAVDPKFDFVILNIGTDQGVEKRGVLLVAREGRLVGKVKVANVEASTSVANVIPGWKLGDIREGDLVLY